MQFEAGHEGESEWPSDMLIAEEWCERPLLELLHARCAWDIHVEGRVPPALMPSPSRLGRRPDLGTAWGDAWAAAVASVANRPDFTMTANPAAAFLAWRETAPAPWGEEHPDAWDAFEFESWVESLPVESLVGFTSAVVSALTHAWRAGLHELIVLPIAEPYVALAGPRRILVSQVTRETPHLLADALNRF